MTLRKQMLWMILLTVVLSVGLNSLLSGGYIDTYFRGYIQTQYDQHVGNISDFATVLLMHPDAVPNQAAADLSRYLKDPIIQIQIQSRTGEVLLNVASSNLGMHETMMRGRRFQTEQDQFELKSGNQILGYVIILRTGAIQSSESVLLFKSALRIGGLISGAIVLVIAIVFASWISRRMTRDLKKTADYASALQTHGEAFSDYSKTTEINAIQMSLQDLSTKLKLQNDVQKEKADQLAHEARTPLTLLKTHVEGVIDGVIEMDSSRLESCLHEIDTLTKVVGNISQVIDYKDVALTVTPETFDLIADAKKIFKGLRLQFEQKKLALILTAPNDLLIHSDRILLSQVLYNLLTNAYKFTPEGGQVELRLHKASASSNGEWADTERVEIAVCDNGIGFDEDLISQLYKPYYREPKVRHIPGEGLGLYIAKRNVEALGGQLTATSLPEGGSCFVVVLPLRFMTSDAPQ